ncbi:amidohydrolase family protein [Streptomyces sp. NPDC015184]|uniref:amidohydrolase family protein n=1 Tax=Streptomyces sp. NPDC015184 TaxID=3364946 RepID=UPI003701A0D7
MHPGLVLLSARLLDVVTGEPLPQTALAVSGGRISALDDDRRIRALAGPATTVIDLKDSVVAPGLVDGHIHPLMGAELAHGPDLSGCATLNEVRQALARETGTLAPERGCAARALTRTSSATGPSRPPPQVRPSPPSKRSRA